MIEVSVVVPTFRRLDFLRRALKSVCGAIETAALTDVEVIVVDDGHDKATSAICGEFAATQTCRTTYARTQGGPGAGPSAARDQGIRSAAGAFIYLLDDDDQFLPNRFARSLPLLRSGEADVVLEPTLRVYADEARGAPFITGPQADPGCTPFHFILRGGPSTHISQNAVAFTKAEYVKVGGYDRRLRYGEDSEILLRFCALSKVALVAGEPVARYTIHEANTSRPENLDYWQNMKVLGYLYRKLAGRKIGDGDMDALMAEISGKLDFALSQYRRDVPGYLKRLSKGLRIISYFPMACLSANNLRTLAVFFLRGRAA